jgi:predicted dehydrogenase
MSKYKAVIIGAGSIGALKPDHLDSPHTANILTMAHAFHSHPEIELVGIIDKDIGVAEKAAKKWQCAPFHVINSFSFDIDIVAICVDTEQKNLLVKI